MGLVLGPGGVLQQVEIRGPASFAEWEAGMKVLRVVVIMFMVAVPANYDYYTRKVRRLYNRYGPRAWALLYQAEARMRREHFIRILRLASTTKPKGFDPEKPWGYVFKAAADDRDYWSEEFVEVAQTARLDNKAADKEVGTDSAIAGGVTLNERVDDRVRDQGRGRDRGSGGDDRKRKANLRIHDVGPDGLLKTNRQGHPLCKGFQTGACKVVKGQIRCPVNYSDHHQCGKCLDPRHGAYKCPCDDEYVKEPPKSVQRQQDRRGRGGGRGGRGGWR